MSINLVTMPTAGVPVDTDDYDAQNNLLQALLYFINNKEPRYLTEWDTTDEPEIKQGVYIQHGGNIYLVEDDNEAISGSPGDGRVYIKITESGGVLSAAFVTSASGYSWNDVYNGFYHADGSQLLPVIIILSGTGTVWNKYTLDYSVNKYSITDNLEIAESVTFSDEINCYADNSTVTLKQVSTGNSAEFYIKKPITAYIDLYTFGAGSSAGLQLYQDGAYRTIYSLGASGGTVTTYGIMLNPGKYKLYAGASGLAHAYLYATGVFGAAEVDASEILEDV